MNKIIIQIYEIQEPSEAAQLIEMGVDHIGSVIVSGSDWKMPIVRDTIELVRRSESRSSLILLFNQPKNVYRALDYYQPQLLHFCEMLQHAGGQLDDGSKQLLEFQTQVRERYPEIKIIRSIPIPPTGKRMDFPFIEIASQFEPVSDFFLTDTLLFEGAQPAEQQPVQGFVGITGKTCDWLSAGTLVRTCRIPVILAGGLSPENVVGGIAQVRPAGVDSCTLTNQCTGNGKVIRFKKDMKKVFQFVKAARWAAETMSGIEP